MNGYGARAQAYWREHRPEDYRMIPEPERGAFFTRLGEDIEAGIARRTGELAGQEEPADPVGFKARYALLNTLRHTAEQEVLAQVLPAPQEAPG